MKIGNSNMWKKFVCATSVLTTSTVNMAIQPSEQSKPNVLFIMIDDYGWADTGYNGSRFYETPNLDRLAAESMVFTNGYAAAPISSPTRVSVMTGKYPARTRITDWIPGYQHGLSAEQWAEYRLITPEIQLNMPLEEITIAEALKEKGYATYHVGKWHCSEDSLYYPQYQGFDVNVGGWSSGSPRGVGKQKGGNGAYSTPYNNPYLSDGPEGEFLTDRLTCEAIKLIENTEKNQPFFMYLAFYAVHVPIEPKPEYVEKFQTKARLMGIDQTASFTTDVEWYRNSPRPKKHWKERTLQNSAEYAALVYSMDENIGRIMQAIKDNSMEENTIVCLLSDNGGLSTAEGSPTCNAPLRGGKGWLYEGGIRVPYLIKYPKLLTQGKECDMPVSSVDFYPTILDVAGLPLKPAQHIDGVSLLPLLEGDTLFDRGPVYFHYPHYGGKGDRPSGAVRDSDYKLIEFYEDGHVELYDLKNDLSETTDLSEEKPETTMRLLRLLNEWRQCCGAMMPRVNVNYREDGFDNDMREKL